MKNRWSEYEDKTIKENAKTKTVKEMACLLKSRTESAVHSRLNYLNMAGIGIGKNSKSHFVYSVNNNFFSDISLINSYWAGFIAADGNIRKLSSGTSDLLRIKLSVRDRLHLERFKNDICFDGNIKTYKQTSKLGTYANYVEMSLASNQICSDLKQNWNIAKRKTWDYVPVKIKERKHLDAFLIGYLDGDGTIAYYNKKIGITQLTIIVVGTKELVLLFKERFEEILNRKCPNISKENKTNHLYRFSVSGKNAVEIYKHLQPVNVPKLKRKWDFYPKSTWGYERWVDNRNEYCGKLLYFNKGKKLSWHYHLKKIETFFLHSGKVIVLYGFDDDIKKSTEILLKPGDSFHIPLGMRHRMIAIENSYIFEFSTQHFEEDSYRIIKGD